MQLLSYQAPLSALLLVGFVPIFDNYTQIVAYKMTFLAGSAIAASACLAFLVNMSTFMIIGKMSAITYNVAGHAKLCFVLAMGYLLFDNKFSWLNMIGVSVAIAGVVAYSVIKLMPGKPAFDLQSTENSSTEHTAIFLNKIVSENEEAAIIPKRSLLIFNNEPVLSSGENKISSVFEGEKEKNCENELVALIK